MGIAFWRYRRRARGPRWGWERVVFAVLIWVVVTVIAGSPLGLLAFTVAHGGPDANPWTAAPLLLLALPVYAVAELLICRWAARDDSAAQRGPQPSRPTA